MLWEGLLEEFGQKSWSEGEDPAPPTQQAGAVREDSLGAMAELGLGVRTVS